MTGRIPMVGYLVLDPEPHLVARECTSCGARFFDRRNACASCGGTEFRLAEVAGTGEVVAFSIVETKMPGVASPYVAAIVDCDGTTVRGNVVHVTPDPEHVHLGMKVRLTTTAVGTDSAGTEAIAYAFEPLEATTDGE
jgi:uncharacterized OB-fold protein